MDNNFENVLKSILPLIIIIIVSWLISSLGSRLKKQPGMGQAEEQTADKTITDRSLLDILIDPKDEASLPGNDAMGGRPSDSAGEYGRPRSSYPTSGPVVTPDPIKPKWWGA